MPKYRINRALALGGIASRRKAEQYIRDGRVKINGVATTNLATEIDSATDVVTVDNRRLTFAGSYNYYLFYKPRGMVSTMRDPSGRECIGNICTSLDGHVRPVGRLDRKSEGLLLLTDDGEVANRLAHPRYGVRKEYRVTISPQLAGRDAAKMTTEVPLRDGSTRFVGMDLLGNSGNKSRVSVVVDEGRNHLVRRVFGFYGYDVLLLRRIRQGPLTLGRLKPGEIRKLGPQEIASLRNSLKIDAG